MIGYQTNNHFDLDHVKSKIKETGDDFIKAFGPYTNIIDDMSYQTALVLFEDMLTNSEENDMTTSLVIDLLMKAIEKYEDSLEEVIALNQAAESLDPALSTLQILMEQHNLKNKDMAELIGSEALVSMILHGRRELTRTHINNLSRHFKISPALFFNSDDLELKRDIRRQIKSSPV